MTDTKHLIDQNNVLRRVNRVLRGVFNERVRQLEKWGDQTHPDGTGDHAGQDFSRQEIAEFARFSCEQAFKFGEGTWRHILAEEVAEAMAESDPEKLEAELEQVAAVAVAWIEDSRRRRGAS